MLNTHPGMGHKFRHGTFLAYRWKRNGSHSSLKELAFHEYARALTSGESKYLNTETSPENVRNSLLRGRENRQPNHTRVYPIFARLMFQVLQWDVQLWYYTVSSNIAEVPRSLCTSTGYFSRCTYSIPALGILMCTTYASNRPRVRSL